MRPVWLWASRGLSAKAAWAMVGLAISSLLTTEAAAVDPNWGVRSLAAATYFFAPILAAAVAYDVGQRLQPSLGIAMRSTVRGMLTPYLSLVGGLLAALAVHAAAWTGIAVASARREGMPLSDLWIAPETVAVLLAASSVGLMIGSIGADLLSAVLAAAVVLLAEVITQRWELGLFTVATSAGTSLGIERTPGRASAAIAVNVGVAVACLVVAWALTGVTVTRPRRAAVVGLVPLAVVLLARPALLPADSEYRPSSQAQVCVGTAPVVCGPSSGQNILETVQLGLAAELVRLRPSGLPFPQRYAVARGSAASGLSADTAALDVDPTVADGRLPTPWVAATLAVPRSCEALTDAVRAQPLLARIDTVQTWLETQLSSGSVTPAPPAVVDAYRDLRACGA